MTAPRSRVLRPARTIAAEPQCSAQQQARFSRLEPERKGFNRWLSRLKRAYRAVEKNQGRIAGLERQLSQNG